MIVPTVIRPWVNWVGGKITRKKLGKWEWQGWEERNEGSGFDDLLLCKSLQNGAIVVQLYFSTVHTSLTGKEKRKVLLSSKEREKKNNDIERPIDTYSCIHFLT